MTIETSPAVTASSVAKAAGIAPRTKRFEVCDNYGLAYEGGRTAHVMAALCRSDLTPALDYRTRIVANGLYKCYNTGRMNPYLANRLTAYTPYQVCRVVAKIANAFPGDPTIGALADDWINAHADSL
jgi:hypothetical protein